MSILSTSDELLMNMSFNRRWTSFMMPIPQCFGIQKWLLFEKSIRVLAEQVYNNGEPRFKSICRVHLMIASQLQVLMQTKPIKMKRIISQTWEPQWILSSQRKQKTSLKSIMESPKFWERKGSMLVWFLSKISFEFPWGFSTFSEESILIGSKSFRWR